VEEVSIVKVGLVDTGESASKQPSNDASFIPDMRINPLLSLLCGSVILTSCNALNSIKKNPAKIGKPKEMALEIYHGIASWYSIKTNSGRTTASGRLLADGASTAAHMTLPFGTRVRVTSMFNGKSEILRITDRGPSVKGRLIDVTIGCAQRLGFHSRGITKVKVEVLSRGTWKYRRL
jgi:rare lipoprotein A